MTKYIWTLLCNVPPFISKYLANKANKIFVKSVQSSQCLAPSQLGQISFAFKLHLKLKSRTPSNLILLLKYLCNILSDVDENTTNPLQWPEVSASIFENNGYHFLTKWNPFEIERIGLHAICYCCNARGRGYLSEDSLLSLK